MSKGWLVMGLGACIAIAVGTVALNTEVERVGAGQQVTTDTAQKRSPDSTTQQYNTAIPADQKFDSQSERIEAQMLADIEQLNVEIAQAKAQLDKETRQAQSEEESPELVLAQAGKILSELEQQGVSVSYDPLLLTTEKSSKRSQEIEQQITTIEADLIEVETRFDNLGHNQEKEQ